MEQKRSILSVEAVPQTGSGICRKYKMKANKRRLQVEE